MFIIVYIYREFSSRTQKKITPTQSVNSRPKLQFDLISYYKPEKWLNPPPPSPRVYANYEIPLERSMYIFNCNKTVAAIMLTHL